MSSTTQKRAAKKSVQRTPSPAYVPVEQKDLEPDYIPEEPKAAKPVATPMRRNEVVFKAKEYKVLKPSGATFMMQQSGVTVYDEKTDSVREIRYCPNEPSVFRDKQSPNSVRESVIFRDGRIFVPKEKPNLLAFLDLHPGNKANNGSVFAVVDKKAKARQDVSAELIKAEAILLIRDKSFEELLSVAVALGINVDRPAEEVKHDLLVEATARPKVFIDSFDNPEVEMRAKVKQAAKYNILKITKDAVRWFDSARIIISIPAGRDPIDVFVKYCMTEAGSAIMTEIDKQM
jgi:hypothetical protein